LVSHGLLELLKVHFHALRVFGQFLTGFVDGLLQGLLKPLVDYLERGLSRLHLGTALLKLMFGCQFVQSGERPGLAP
jgi:hypothetical protein